MIRPNLRLIVLTVTALLAAAAPAATRDQPAAKA